MFISVVCMLLFVDSVVSRNVPNFKELDEDDQMLFRAAYDTTYSDAPSYYNQDAYKPQPYPNDYSNEIPASKLDLLSDGLWALKAKVKELKAFNKALAANLLATKLKVKEVLESLKLKKLQHEHVQVDMPGYTYQPPTPSYPQHQPGYISPQYSTPATAPQYHHYGAPQPYDPYHGQ